MNLTLAPISVSAIGAGALFFHRSNTHAALAMKLNGAPHQWSWLNLNSNLAFSYQELSSQSSPKTVVPVSHAMIGGFKVDPDSVSTTAAIKPGYLAIDINGSAVIIASSAGSSEASIGITLGNWSLTTIPSIPVVAFERWSLGYFDSANQWVELFHRQ